MLDMNDSFSEWLNSEMKKRGVSQAKLAKDADVSKTSISDILSEKHKAGYDVCMGISRALRIPPEDVLRSARLLPAIPESTRMDEELLYLFRSLSAAEKADLLRYIRIRLAMSE